MKKFLVLFLVLFACTAYAQGIPSPSTPRLMADDAGNYVSQSYPLPVSVSGADVAAIDTIASSSEAIEAELLSVGTAVDIIASSSEAIEAELLSVGTAVDTIASSSGAIDNNIASISDALSNPLEWKVSVASVTSTISTFTSQLTSDNRRFVAIKNRDAFKPIYLGFDNAVTVETGLPINDTLYIEAPKDVPLYFISAKEVGIVLLEGGR